jgi:hypothetical protein
VIEAWSVKSRSSLRIRRALAGLCDLQLRREIEDTNFIIDKVPMEAPLSTQWVQYLGSQAEGIQHPIPDLRMRGAPSMDSSRSRTCRRRERGGGTRSHGLRSLDRSRPTSKGSDRLSDSGDVPYLWQRREGCGALVTAVDLSPRGCRLTDLRKANHAGTALGPPAAIASELRGGRSGRVPKSIRGCRRACLRGRARARVAPVIPRGNRLLGWTRARHLA